MTFSLPIARNVIRLLLRYDMENRLPEAYKS